VLSETENTAITLYDGATLLMEQDVQPNGQYVTSFSLVYIFDSPVTAAKTFTLKISRITGNGTHFLFHSPADGRPVTILAEDIGPSNTPPTS
jgi:hypothetical protein